MKRAAFILLICILMPAQSFAISEADRINAVSETDKALHSADSQMKQYLREKSEIKEVAGNRWLHLPVDEKKEAITHSMVILGSLGIVYDHDVDHYYKAVADYLKTYPDKGTQTVSEILAAIIYETQPESRAILEKL